MMIDRFELEQLQKRIDLIKKHVFVVMIPIQRYMIDSAEPGVETVVTYDLGDAWRNYAYHINKVLFRMQRGLIALEKVFDWLKTCFKDMEPKDESACIFIPCNPEAVEVAYECEDMIIAFPCLYEQEYVQDIIKFLGNNDLSREFIDNIPKRSDPRGLYWRINLLRNRMAHPTRGAYCNSKNARRFMDITPMPFMVRYQNGVVAIESNLIDLEKNPSVQAMIDEVVLQKKYGEELGEKSIFDILFPETKAKGHGKRKPQVIYPDYERFDYNRGFISLSNQMLDMLDKQMLVFLKAGLSRVNNDVTIEKCMFYDNQSISINELYDLSRCKWK